MEHCVGNFVFIYFLNVAVKTFQSIFESLDQQICAINFIFLFQLPLEVDLPRILSPHVIELELAQSIEASL